MTSETTQQQASTANDFSNYTWFPGANEKFNAASISTHEGRVFLGLKGYDNKRGGHGYIRAEFDYEALEQLRDHLTAILDGDAEVA